MKYNYKNYDIQIARAIKTLAFDIEPEYGESACKQAIVDFLRDKITVTSRYNPATHCTEFCAELGFLTQGPTHTTTLEFGGMTFDADAVAVAWTPNPVYAHDEEDFPPPELKPKLKEHAARCPSRAGDHCSCGFGQ